MNVIFFFFKFSFSSITFVHFIFFLFLGNIVSCTTPERVSFGHVQMIQNDSDSGIVFAKYSCYRGFSLKGYSLRKCESLGEWSGKAPYCGMFRKSAHNIELLCNKKRSLKIISMKVKLTLIRPLLLFLGVTSQI